MQMTAFSLAIVFTLRYFQCQSSTLRKIRGNSLESCAHADSSLMCQSRVCAKLEIGIYLLARLLCAWWSAYSRCTGMEAAPGKIDGAIFGFYLLIIKTCIKVQYGCDV